MKRVLAISWEMPPMYGPRAAQVSRTLAELPALGWSPIVVTMQPRPGGPHWFGGAASEMSDVKLVRVRSPQESIAVRAMWRLLPPLRDYPDTARPWVSRAAREATTIAESESASVILSFAQPWSDHLVGFRVHRSTRLPWVAHFSDPWADSPYATARQRRIWGRMEAEVAREATALVFVTQETADLVMKKYPAEWRTKVAIVPHGFDPRAAMPASRPAGRAGPMRPMSIVYTGRFYDGVRTPIGLFRALASLNQLESLAGAIVVSFVGPHVADYRGEADRLGVGALVAFQDRVPASTAAEKAAEADVLLVIDAASDGPGVFLPSKLIDYLAFRKPILGITPDPGASAQLLHRLNCPVAAPGDVDAIARAIDGLLARWRHGTIAVDEAFDRVAADYDIRNTSRILADVLARACA